MAEVSDQFSERTVALCIRSAKITPKILAQAMRLSLRGGRKLANHADPNRDMTGKGKQTVKQLTQQGQGVSNIEITTQNIKSFESVARKYGIDFALKKDATETPPKWLVFFKAKDADVLTVAFKDFTAKEATRGIKKPSVFVTMKNFAEKVASQVLDKVPNKARGGHVL